VVRYSIEGNKVVVIYSALTIVLGFILGIFLQQWLTLKVFFIIPFGTLIFGVILTSGLYFGLERKRIKPSLIICIFSVLIGGAMFLAVYYWNFRALVDGTYMTFPEFLKWTIENSEVSFFYRFSSTAREPVNSVWYNYFSFGINLMGAMIGSSYFILGLRRKKYCKRCKQAFKKHTLGIISSDSENRLKAKLYGFACKLQESDKKEVISNFAQDWNLSEKFRGEINMIWCPKCLCGHILIELKKYDSSNETYKDFDSPYIVSDIINCSSFFGDTRNR